MDENTTAASGSTGAAGDETGRFSRARDYVGEKYGDASGKVRDTYNSMRERADDIDLGEVTDQVRTYVRDNPGKALLMSVGVGFLIGLLLRHDEEE